MRRLLLLLMVLLAGGYSAKAQTEVARGPVNPATCDPNRGLLFWNNTTFQMFTCVALNTWGPFTTPGVSILSGPFASRPGCNNGPAGGGNLGNGDLYIDTDDVNSWKCLGGTWSSIGLPAFPTVPVGVPEVLAYTPTNAAALWALSGVPGRSISGASATDTILSTDCSNRVQYTTSVAVAITLPTPGALQVPFCSLKIANKTSPASNLTITPSGGWTINGTSSYVVSGGNAVVLNVDPLNNSNWSVDTGGGGGAAITAVQYVSATGNDANDGTTWATAKLTIYSAMLALPGAIASPPTRGNGTIYVSDGAHANPTTNAGIWIMSSTDTNYASPPAGWVRDNSANNTLAIIGVGCPFNSSNHSGGNVCKINSGNSPPSTPVLWVSGASGMTFQNLQIIGGIPVALAVDSTGNRTNTSAVNKVFENVVLIASNTVGNGPAITIGGNAFNNYFNHMGGDAVAANVVNISTVTRASNVTTVVTSGAHHITTGMHCGIFGVTDTTFNGSFYNVTFVNSTTLTVPNSGPNGSSSGGVIACDNAMYIVMDPAGAAIGVSLTYVTNSEFNNAGVRFWNMGSSTESFYVENIYTENAYTPAVWMVLDSTSSGTVKNVAIADSPNNAPTIENDGTAPVLQEGSCPCVGQYKNVNDGGAVAATVPALQGQSGQLGIIRNFLRAGTNVAAAAPQAVRYVNQAGLPATWFLANALGTLTQGVTDRDGGTSAVSTSVSGLDYITFTNFADSQNVGDWLIAGVWGKQTITNGITQPLQIYQLSQICANNGGFTYTTNTMAPYAGTSGTWDWYAVACKIQQSGSGGNLQMRYQIVGANSATVYNPVLLKIPVGTVTDAEAMEVMQNLRSYSTACTVGQICDNIGAVAHLPGTFGGSPSSGYTFTSSPVSAPFNGNLLVATVEQNSGTQVFSAGSGWTLVSPSGCGTTLGMEYRVAGSATSYTGNFTSNQSLIWVSTINAFTNSGTPALVQSKCTTANNALAYTSNNAAGNLLFAVIRYRVDLTGPITGVTCNSNTWKLAGLRALEGAIGASWVTGPSHVVEEIWYAPNSNSGACTVTAAGISGTSSELFIAEFSGVATSGTVMADYNYNPDGTGNTASTTISGAVTNPQNIYSAVNNVTGVIDIGGSSSAGGVYNRDHAQVFNAAAANLASTGGTLYHKKGIYYGQTSTQEVNNGQTGYYVFALPPSPSGGNTQVYWNVLGETATQPSFLSDTNGTIFQALPSAYAAAVLSNKNVSIIYQRPAAAALNNSDIFRDETCRIPDNQRGTTPTVCFDSSQATYSEHTNTIADTTLSLGNLVGLCAPLNVAANGFIGYKSIQSATNETYMLNTWANGWNVGYQVNSNHPVMINAHSQCGQTAAIFNVTGSTYGGTLIHFQDNNNITGIQFNCTQQGTFYTVDEIVQPLLSGTFTRTSNNSESVPGNCVGTLHASTASGNGATLAVSSPWVAGSGINFRTFEAQRALTPGLVTSNFTSAATTGTTKQTLATYSFPFFNNGQGTTGGIFLNNSGAVIRIRAWGINVSNTGNDTLEIDFGGTLIASVVSTQANSAIRCEAEIIVSSVANTQEIVGTCDDGTLHTVTRTAPAITGNAAIVLNIAMTSAAGAGQGVFKGMTIEYVGGQ